MTNEFGVLELVSASQVEAGELAVIELRYVAGSVGLEPGGSITVDTESDSDWGQLQVSDPTAGDYLSVIPPSGTAVSGSADHV